MPNVLGYLVQCEVCPQQVLLAEYAEGWTCPRCTEVASDVPVADAPLWRMSAPGSFRIDSPVGEYLAVQLPDGRVFTENFSVDGSGDQLRRAHAAIGSAWAAADAILNPDPGFGDVDVEQAEPLSRAEQVALQRRFDEISARHAAAEADEPELPYKPPAEPEPLCGDQSTGGRVCVEASPHVGQSHRSIDGWRWWRDGGPAFGPGGTEDTSLSEVRG